MVFGKDQDPRVNGHRPLKYLLPEDLQRDVDKYFLYCDSQNVKDGSGKLVVNEPYMITGLCDYIGITQNTWNDYGKREGYEDIVIRAKQRVESFVLKMASLNKINPIISIFNLKNNFGYTDKIDVNTNTHTEYVNVLDIEKLVDDEKKLISD